MHFRGIKKIAKDMNSSPRGKNKQSATDSWAPQHPSPGGTKWHRPWKAAEDHKSPLSVHFCQAFPGTFQLDLKSDSLPWAIYVTKGKT